MIEIDIDKIEKLINLVTKNNITELDIQNGTNSLKIKNPANDTKNKICCEENSSHFTNSAEITLTRAHANNLMTETSKNISAANFRNTTAISIPPAKDPSEEGIAIASPMVGMVYLSPSPTEKNFVEIGQRVTMGDTLCLIEAMKTFNKIEADRSGMITSRLVQNAQPVEYGQKLFIIKED